MVSGPKAPKEDPETKRLREAEQARSERDRLASIQDQLKLETRLRSGSFGLRSLLGPLSGIRNLRSLLGSG